MLERLGQIYHPSFDDAPGFIGRSMIARTPVFVEDVSARGRRDVQLDDEILAIYRELAAISFMIIPLVARGQLRGALTLARSESQAHYTRDDLAIAEELAPRIALAIDNARLYQEAQVAVQRQNESLALLNLVLISAPIGFAFQDCELRYVHINERLAQLNRLPPEQHIGRTLHEIAPRSAAFVEARLRQVLETGVPLIDIEISGMPPDSTSQRHWLASYYPVRTPNGHTLGVGTIVNDITSRKQSEDELRHQNEILQHIFDYAPIILAFYDADGQFRLVNREWERVLGWSVEEMHGRDMLAEFYPDPARRQEVLEYMLAAEPGWHEFQVQLRDGRVLDTLWANVRLSDGTSIGLGQDITDRKRLEARFLHSQKMESVGRLAGGIAHDFNNLLTVIIGFAELTLGDLAPADPLCANLLEIRRSADRAATLTRQLLAFARKQIISPQVTNLNDLIIDMDRLLRRLIGEDIELIVLPAPELLSVKIDPHQIEQVLVNLVVNARDAMPNGGKLIIETRNILLDQAYIDDHAGAMAGPHVLLRVVDSGVGMDPVTREHVFEPFFTTKGPGKGTGLGLATCYGIVKQHDGYITIDSAVGQGTTVEIYLPIAQDAASGAPLVLSYGPLPRGAETILLVEDEASVRRLTSRMLRELGYRVIEAQHGEEALHLVETSALQTYDLLLADVVMPRMGGTELAARLLALRPSLRVLCMSGYTDDQIVERGYFNSGAGFIHKPFSQATLARKVRETLDH